MKRILLLGMIIFLVSCNQQKQDEILEPEEETESEVSIVSGASLSTDQYKMVLPFKPSPAREAINNQISNRLDIDEMAEGLRRLSTGVFSPDKYLYEEGQYLTETDIFALIDALNPDVEKLKGDDVKDDDKKEDKIKEYRKNPRVFSHILEQNYLLKQDDSVHLAGVSIGIALKSTYRFQVEEGGANYYEDISKSEMKEVGQKVADQLLDQMRENDELEDVPILMTLFWEEEQSAPIPGDFVAKTIVEEGDMAIHDWENLNEEHFLFPSDKAKKKHNDDYQKVKIFNEKIANYFPNYVGAAGTGFYIEDNLTTLSLEIPIEFYGKGEVIGFTQYVYAQLKEIFSNEYDLEVTISSSDGQESLIFRKAGEKDPTVHIY